MKKIQQRDRRDWTRVGIFFGLGLVAGLVMLIGIARLSWHSKFYPGISIAGVEIAGLTREQARVKLAEVIRNYHVKFMFNGSEWEIPKEAVEFQIEATLNTAYHHGRRAKIEDYLLLLINRKTNYPLLLSEGRTEELETLINEIASGVEITPVEPMIEVKQNKVTVTNGSDGIILDGEALDRVIGEAYANLSNEPILVPTKEAMRQLSQDKLAQLQTRAETLVDKSLMLTLDDEKIRLGGEELVAMLATNGGEEILNTVVINDYAMGLFESLNKEPQDARFEFSDGEVKEFAPGRDGIEISVQLTANGIQQVIEKLLNEDNKSETVEIVVIRTSPKVTMEKVNELGIRERIGRGESYYAHSIANRIYNVGLAAARINSALIAPGEEFSFNKVVGEVSGATGYREAYVISKGRTVLGDGGGVCQVSTTIFRAAMSAGLPITERWGHAYRVSYYELNSKPGVDATVYAPSKDVKFKNDTPGHILIQTINDPKNLHLIIEIYGTSDGRVATISEPKVWGISPPLPTIYQDDPTLPTGTMKQVDWAAPGAKASFEYKVVRDGEVLQEKTFFTSYRPWAAVYLRGTGI